MVVPNYGDFCAGYEEVQPVLEVGQLAQGNGLSVSRW